MLAPALPSKGEADLVVRAGNRRLARLNATQRLNVAGDGLDGAEMQIMAAWSRNNAR